MTCSEFQRELPEYMEDGGNAELKSHLKSCASCSGLVSSLESIVQEAPYLQATEEPSPRVWNSIEIILRQEKLIRDPRPHHSILPSLRQRWGIAAWLVPAAAALLVGAGILLYPTAKGGQNTSTQQAALRTKAADAKLASDQSDEQLLQEVSMKAPMMRAAYESNLNDVNNYIRDAQESVNADPNDEEAQQALMDAYGQKSMIYEMALDPDSAIIDGVVDLQTPGATRYEGSMHRSQYAAEWMVVGLITLASVAVAETKKEFRFEVGPKSKVSILNQFGSVSVKPSTGNYVLVNATIYSDRVEVDHAQSGNRVDVQSHLLPGAKPENSRVDYEVLVPADASVDMESATGPLRAEKLHGDVEVEGSNAAIDVRDISGSHVHVKTMTGAITLTNIRDGHVEIDSVSGDVTLNSVTGPLVRVSSTSGKIQYDGDFGYAGEYRFNSHSGNIDATIPNDASVDVKAQSVRGQVLSDVQLQPKVHTSFLVKEGSSFAGTINKAASSVWLRTFSGKIHLKKR